MELECPFPAVLLFFEVLYALGYCSIILIAVLKTKCRMLLSTLFVHEYLSRQRYGASQSYHSPPFHHPRLRNQIHSHINNCVLCATDKTGKFDYGEFTPREAIPIPWQEVHVVYIGNWTIKLNSIKLTFRALTSIEPICHCLGSLHKLLSCLLSVTITIRSRQRSQIYCPWLQAQSFSSRHGTLLSFSISMCTVFNGRPQTGDRRLGTGDTLEMIVQ